MARAKGASLLGAVRWLRHDREAGLRALPERCSWPAAQASAPVSNR